MAETTVYKIDLERIDGSSNISAMGYDAKRSILAVEFKSGDVFHYAAVPPETAGAFYTAESRGKFYAANIRGKFTGDKMTEKCEDCGALGYVGERCPDCGCRTIARKPYTPRAQR